MPTFNIEIASESVTVAVHEMEALGANILPGYEPVPMPHQPGRPDSIVLTMEVPENLQLDRISSINGVLEVFGDPQISHFGLTE